MRNIRLSAVKISLLHIFTLFTLACAQPLFSLLDDEKSNPFFIAHQTEYVGAVILAVFWSLVVPGMLALIVFLAAKISRDLGRALYVAIALVLLLCLCLPLCAHNIAIASLLSVFLLFVLVSYDFAYRFANYLSVSVFVSLALFLMSSPIRNLANHGDLAVQKIATSDKPNIVLVVFDQIPLTSLLNDELGIDERLFPNFARLAKTSTWYSNAATPYTHTRDAIPAILTASKISTYRARERNAVVEIKNRTPDQSNFPKNFFTMFAGTHHINAFESVTALGPKQNHQTKSSSSFVSLLADSSVIAGHLVVGSSNLIDLPPMTDRWSGFFSVPSIETSQFKYPGERAQLVERFANSLSEQTEPAAHFLHVVLPHVPFEYDAKGRLHKIKRKNANTKVNTRLGVNIWGGKEGTKEGFALHIEQLRFVDVLLGHVMNRLREKNLFDNSVLVVTADHGIDFFWDDESLALDTVKRIRDINMNQIPLFIKAPGQKEGAVDKGPALSIDILPTIAAMLNQPVPWKTDGISLIGEDRAKRAASDFVPNISAQIGHEDLLKEVIKQTHGPLAEQKILYSERDN